MKGTLLSHTESGANLFSTQRRIAAEIACCEDALRELNNGRFPCETRLLKQQSFERFIRRRREALDKLRASQSRVAPETDAFGQVVLPVQAHSLQAA